VSLFRTMDYGRLETAHTRALAWLLNPQGEHRFGSALLAGLLQRLTRLPTQIVQAKVFSEYVIDAKDEETGRIDILAEGQWINADGALASWLLLVEAKIDAIEAQGQLARYDDWAADYAPHVKPLRLFLTREEGREAKTGRAPWTPMSFAELVQVFRTSYTELRAAPGFHFLRYYLAGVLQDVCGWPLPISPDCRDPYTVSDYLKIVNATSGRLER
jgi:hypothetical protein